SFYAGIVVAENDFSADDDGLSGVLDDSLHLGSRVLRIDGAGREKRQAKNTSIRRGSSCNHGTHHPNLRLALRYHCLVNLSTPGLSALLLITLATAGEKRLEIPLGLDSFMPVPEANSLTPEKVAMGRDLFSDRRLSRDRTIS